MTKEARVIKLLRPRAQGMLEFALIFPALLLIDFSIIKGRFCFSPTWPFRTLPAKMLAMR